MHCATGGSGGHDVRSARADHVGVEKRLHEERQPVAIDACVGVRVGHDLAGGFSQADVARGAQAAVRDVDDAHAAVGVPDLARAVLRAVVDQNDFVVGVRELLERREAFVDRVGGVVRADDDGDARPVALPLGRERRVPEGRRHRLGGGFGTPIAIDQPECPVVHRVAAAPPLVGPREGHGAARAFFERGANLHRRDLGLARFAFTDAVGARLGQQQRLVSGDVLQSREVRAQFGLAMQVDVEGADVEERQVEEFGRRKVDVREQAAGRRRLRVLEQVVEKVFDAHAAVPAHHPGRDFVAERKRQHCRMVPELGDLRGDLAANRPLQAAIVEKRDVLRPRHPDHDAQSVPRGFVEQIAVRRRVGADGVEAETRHQTEVFGDAGERGELVPLRIRREGAVRHTLHEEPVVPGAQKLSVRGDPRCGRGPRVVPDLAGRRELQCSQLEVRPSWGQKGQVPIVSVV